MLVGAFHFPTDYGIEIGELARALEARGFESLFVCEHTHIPVNRRTPFPAGGELPKRYSHTHDPFVALSFAAATTRSLKLGTGIALLPQRDPIITAKSVASLDQLCGGRFVFAVGGGWNVEEMENHGARYDSRFKLLRERVLAMKALWTQEEAQFHGQFVNFDPVWLYPKPKQKPHPPVLLGGESDHTVRRVVEAGSRVRAASSSQKTRRNGCAGPPAGRGGIHPRSRSLCLMRPRIRRRWRLTATLALPACSSKCRIAAATRSCGCWTRKPRSAAANSE
jgi:probable F420-dependent oxidoreductase